MATTDRKEWRCDLCFGVNGPQADACQTCLRERRLALKAAAAAAAPTAAVLAVPAPLRVVAPRPAATPVSMVGLDVLAATDAQAASDALAVPDSTSWETTADSSALRAHIAHLQARLTELERPQAVPQEKEEEKMLTDG